MKARGAELAELATGEHAETAAAAAAAAPVSQVPHVAHEAALSPLVQLASGAAARGSEPSGGAHDDEGAPNVVKARAWAPSRRQTEVAGCQTSTRANVLAVRRHPVRPLSSPGLLPPSCHQLPAWGAGKRSVCAHSAARERGFLNRGCGHSLASALVPLPARACAADAQAVHDHEAARALDGGGARAVLGGAEAARPCVAEDRRFD